MTTPSQITRSTDFVKQSLVEDFVTALNTLFSTNQQDSADDERLVWKIILDVGRDLLASLLSLRCWEVSAKHLEHYPGARLRLDADYRVTVTTTLGTVNVPTFAFRDAKGKTRNPAKAVVFPRHKRCRSSSLCLEWETWLGGQLPFRQAQEALSFFTHGATQLEDTTIARHTVAIGASIDRSWTYKTPADIQAILQTRATRDNETGKPLLYLSSDACALRRYTDETFEASWKMMNGIRMWCVDAASGGIIHLGGEYTWGNCEEVRACFEQIVMEYIPTGETAPQVVFLTDGMEWLRTWVGPVLPQDTLFILDFYHAMEHLAKYARGRFGTNKRKRESWYRRKRRALLGKRVRKSKTQSTRKGHKKKPRSEWGKRRAAGVVHLSDNIHGAGETLVNHLINEKVPTKHDDRHSKLLNYISENAERMDYPSYRARGIQIGSGAMESLHRIAAQCRLKLPGARWLEETSKAVLNTRMMRLAGRWDDFWQGPGRDTRLCNAFGLGDILMA